MGNKKISGAWENMLTEKEKSLEKQLKIGIEQSLNGLCLKLLSAHITGLPDRLCLIPGGRIFFAEIKTTGEKPRKIQVFMHNKIRGLGFRVEVIDSSERVKKLVQEYEV